MIRGIGAAYARRLVAAFGETVFEVIEADPGRLREVEGIEQLGAGAQQVVFGQAAMALVHRFGESIAHPGTDPHHRVPGDPDLRGDLVGGLEADAADVARQPIRVLADDRDRLGAVGLVDPHRPRGADAVSVQKQHDLADDFEAKLP